MRINIHDVGHGACSVITSSDGRRVMIDAGYRLDPNFFPSIHYMHQTMEMLILQNLDSDHVDDLPYLLKHVPIKSFRSNPTVSADVFFRMKQAAGMNEALWVVHRILSIIGPAYGPTPLFPDFWWQCYWNPYGAFAEANDLSLALFVGSNNFSILFGGDLEQAGWRLLLANPHFRRHLAGIKVLVASHHGRDNGCCEEIFNCCRPDVVVISDYEHRHTTQQTTGWYGHRVKGIVDKTSPFYGIGGPTFRRALTTRSDGSLQIDVRPDGSYTIYKHTNMPETTAADFLFPSTHGLLGFGSSNSSY